MNVGKYYRDYHPADIAHMDVHPIFGDDCLVKLRCRKAAEGNLVFTVISPNDEVLAVVGMSFIYSKVAEVWTIADKKISKCPVYYMRAIKQMLAAFFEMLELERVQIVVRTDSPWALKFGTFLGMKLEAVMSKYGEENKDHYLFSKVRA